MEAAYLILNEDHFYDLTEDKQFLAVNAKLDYDRFSGKDTLNCEDMMREGSYDMTSE
jgi:hypothetical protein